MFTKFGKNVKTLFLIIALVMFSQPALARDGGGRGGGGFRGGAHFEGGSPSMGVSSPDRIYGASFRGGFRGQNFGDSRPRMRSMGGSFRSGSQSGFRKGFFNRGLNDNRTSFQRNDFILNARRGDQQRFSNDRRFFNRNYRFNSESGFQKGFFNNGLYNNRKGFQRNDFILNARRGDQLAFSTPHSFRFFGRHRFINDRIVSPDRFFVIGGRFGHHRFFYPFYPFYHRRFVFYNPFGFWPYYYDYYRYYQYGFMPYYWYGYNAIPYDLGYRVNNYYTYNYYGSEYGPAETPGAYGTQPPDHNALNRAQKLAKPPAAPTKADALFDQGVAAFAKEDYTTAMQKFAEAKNLAPDDKVLPFAYAQAVFAMGNYSAAAQAVRQAVSQINPQTEGVFYPRGLYSDESILLKQVAELRAAAAKDRQNANLQLLLGYNELGMGELYKAGAALKRASADEKNGPAATALLNLVEKLQAAEMQAPQEQTTQTQSPEKQAPEPNAPNTKMTTPETPKVETPVE